MRRLARALACIATPLLLGSCADDGAEPFEFEQIASSEATVSGISLTIEYGADPPVRGSTFRVGRRSGEGYVDAGTFVDSGPEGGSSYYPPDVDDIAGHSVELDGPTDSFLIDELSDGDYIICTRVSGERGEVCAAFTIEG